MGHAQREATAPKITNLPSGSTPRRRAGSASPQRCAHCARLLARDALAACTPVRDRRRAARAPAGGRRGRRSMKEAEARTHAHSAMHAGTTPRPSRMFPRWAAESVRPSANRRRASRAPAGGRRGSRLMKEARTHAHSALPAGTTPRPSRMFPRWGGRSRAPMSNRFALRRSPSSAAAAACPNICSACTLA